ncbi:hypothetical protein P3T37_001291 [Kitasatospora sp. MAA4]|uniref:hypothetical protein n=1 Tax=Kitasatospora sp. MAA4 TaxID=3035093 RepID=UPI0024769DBC|nr:hypothetical protein [Kitasatospora sp. MAA4]MDH6131917.1 hypothetical protein [Kitasatospora sp. MAA4]
MNLRALTRGDAAIAGAAFLLLVSSFLPYWSVDCSAAACSSSAWATNLLPVLPSIYLLGVAAAALILLQKFQGEAAKTRQILGLRLDQWGSSFAVVALWTSLWSLGAGSNHSVGAYLGVLSLLVITGAALAGPLVPALQGPLVSDKPAVPAQQSYPGAVGGGYPGQSFGGQPQPQQGGYGYPGAGQSFGGQPQPQQGGYGFPAPGAGQPQDAGFGQQGAQPSPFGQPEPAFGQPAQAQQAQQAPAFGQQAPQPQQVQEAAPAPAPTPAAAAPAPAAEFAPFWFAVPEPRRLTPKDGAPGPVVGDLVPGTWYLAVEQRGTALVAQLQDGTQGVLSDVSGIQRG